MKKTVSLFLALLLLTLSAAGCSEKTSEGDPGTGAGNAQTGGEAAPAAGEDEPETAAGEERVDPGLPADLDFGGHVFTIMNNDYSIPVWSQIDIGAEEMTGEAINDAVYTRNASVADRYNCTVASRKTLNLPGDLSVAVKAGDDSVDLATVHLRSFADHAQEGLYVELHTVSTMDMTKPWYDHNSVEELSIKHKLYGAATDITLMDKQATTAMVFSKPLYEDYGFAAESSFYDLVKEGRWTYEKLYSMATSVSSDLNGDGKRTEDDLYGLLYQRDTLTSLLNGFGISVMTKNADDVPEPTLMNPEGVDVLDRIFDLIYQRDYCMNVMSYFGESFWSDKMVGMFEESKSLLMWIRLADVENLRTMDIDFGIVPVPMMNEGQGEYFSSVNPYVGTVTCMPRSNYDPESTGWFIEALASESHYAVLPEYYEINLKGKVARDQESRDMLDLIFGNRIYDLGQIYDPGDFANTLIYMTMTDDRDVASKWAKTEKMVNKVLEKMLAKFE